MASSPEERDYCVSPSPRTIDPKSPMILATMKNFRNEQSLIEMLSPTQGVFESFGSNLEMMRSNKRRSISFIMPPRIEHESSYIDLPVTTKRRRFERRNSKTAAMLSKAVMWVAMDELEEENKAEALKNPITSQEDHWEKVEALLISHAIREVETTHVEKTP